MSMILQVVRCEIAKISVPTLNKKIPSPAHKTVAANLKTGGWKRISQIKYSITMALIFMNLK